LITSVARTRHVSGCSGRAPWRYSRWRDRTGRAARPGDRRALPVASQRRVDCV